MSQMRNYFVQRANLMHVKVFLLCANVTAHQSISYLTEQGDEGTCHVFYFSQFVQDTGS